MNNRTVSLLFVAAVALYFGRGVFDVESWLWADFTKALPVALLGVTTWLYGGNKLLPIVMLLSAAGDIAGEHGEFIYLIALFAVAHICFIAYFCRKASFKRERLWQLALWCVILVLFGGFIISNIDHTAFRIACSIYMLIIGSMAAVTLFIDSPRRWYYTAAALIFVFSDSCIAWNKFVEKFAYAGITIMATYFLAQLIFANLYLKEE
ncbi:MAG: lysoplasmalogenase [Alistipes sp.]|nr:lysoplasmalogenase [Alistipes sp.]